MRVAGKKAWIIGGLCFILLLCLYVMLLLLPVKRALKNYDTEWLENKKEELLLKKAKQSRMEEVLSQKEGEEKGILADYNNLQMEIQELHTILAPALSYHMSFEEPARDQGLVRRDVWLDFTVESYGKAGKILEQLQQGRYRCILKEVELSVREGGFYQGGALEGNVLLTFYEHMEEQTQEEDAAALEGE